MSEQSTRIREKLGTLAREIHDLIGIYDVVVETYPSNLDELYQVILKRIYEVSFVTGCTTYPAVGAPRTKAGPLGKPFAYMLISVSPVNIDYVAEKVHELAEVQKTDIVLGSYDIVAEISVGDMKGLTEIINKVLNIDGVITTVTLPVAPG
jgi:hypothetical protein